MQAYQLESHMFGMNEFGAVVFEPAEAAHDTVAALGSRDAWKYTTQGCKQLDSPTFCFVSPIIPIVES